MRSRTNDARESAVGGRVQEELSDDDSLPDLIESDEENNEGGPALGGCGAGGGGWAPPGGASREAGAAGTGSITRLINTDNEVEGGPSRGPGGA